MPSPGIQHKPSSNYSLFPVHSVGHLLSVDIVQSTQLGSGGQDEGHTSSNEPNWKRKDKFLKIEHKFLLIYSEFMHISHTRYNKMSTF